MIQGLLWYEGICWWSKLKSGEKMVHLERISKPSMLTGSWGCENL